MNIKQAEQITQALMLAHGLESWRLELTKHYTIAGRCERTKQVIKLSRRWIASNDADFVTNVVLHEIAHALAPPFSHHDKIWRDIATEIGCDGEVHVAMTAQSPPGKYIAVCEECGFKHTRQRITQKSRFTSCGVCLKAYNPEKLLNFELNLNYQLNKAIITMDVYKNKFGYWVVTDIFEGQMVTRRYLDYSRDEAVAKFKKELKDLTKQ